VTAIASSRLECGYCGAQAEWTFGVEDTNAVRNAQLSSCVPMRCHNCGEPVPIDKEHLLLVLPGTRVVRAADL
jgi:hypothetical protein